jgi:hypothetical protein
LIEQNKKKNGFAVMSPRQKEFKSQPRTAMWILLFERKCGCYKKWNISRKLLAQYDLSLDIVYQNLRVSTEGKYKQAFY